MSTTDKKEKIPRELRLLLRTNVPGYGGDISYKPGEMSVGKGCKDNIINFDPLVYLTSNALRRVPPSMRRSQFCNKGEFASLINSLNQTPVSSFASAKNKGYIKNNIALTIGTLLPSGSQIELGGKKFTIAAVVAEPDEWRLDAKIKASDLLDRSKFTDPRLYAFAAATDVANAKEELAPLIKAGLASGMGVPVGPRPGPGPGPMPPATQSIPQSIPQAIQSTQAIQATPQAIQGTQAIQAIQGIQGRRRQAIEPGSSVEELSDVVDQRRPVRGPVVPYQYVPEDNREPCMLNPFPQGTQLLNFNIAYVSRLVEYIYVYSSDAFRKSSFNKNNGPSVVTIDAYRKTTNILPKHKNLRVKQVDDCLNSFFYEMACAINDYNLNLPEEYIQRQIRKGASFITGAANPVVYGATNDFTSDVLRKIVYKYVETKIWGNEISTRNGEQANIANAAVRSYCADQFGTMAENGRIIDTNVNYIEYLNFLLEMQYQFFNSGYYIMIELPEPFNNFNFVYATTNSKYEEETDTLNDDFFHVYFTNPAAREKYNAPFIPVTNVNKRVYFESAQYRGDKYAIEAMAAELNICAIPFKINTLDYEGMYEDLESMYNTVFAEYQGLRGLAAGTMTQEALDEYIARLNEYTAEYAKINTERPKPFIPLPGDLNAPLVAPYCNHNGLGPTISTSTNILSYKIPPGKQGVNDVKYVFFLQTPKTYQLCYNLLEFGPPDNFQYVFDNPNEIPLYIKFMVFGAVFVRSILNGELNGDPPPYPPLKDDMLQYLASVQTIITTANPVPATRANFCTLFDNLFSTDCRTVDPIVSICDKLGAQLQHRMSINPNSPGAKSFRAITTTLASDVQKRFAANNIPSTFIPRGRRPPAPVNEPRRSRRLALEPGDNIDEFGRRRGRVDAAGGVGYGGALYGGQNSTNMSLMPGREIRNLLTRESDEGKSALAFYVTVYLFLYPGTNIPAGKMRSLNCQARRFKIRQLASKMVGYSEPSIMPEYSYVRNGMIKSSRKNPIPPDEKKSRGGATRKITRQYGRKRETRRRGHKIIKCMTRRRH
jgi:hypothetical protein